MPQDHGRQRLFVSKSGGSESVLNLCSHEIMHFACGFSKSITSLVHLIPLYI